jgi:hypothetical protein
MLSKRSLGLFVSLALVVLLAVGCSAGGESSLDASEEVVAASQEELAPLGRCATMLCMAGTRCVENGTSARCVPIGSRECGNGVCLGLQRCCPGPRPKCVQPFEICPRF